MYGGGSPNFTISQEQELLSHKLSKLVLTSAFTVFSVQANADQCDDFGTTAFACMIEKNNKIVSVCLNNNDVMRYRYGAAYSEPELELYASARDNFDGFYNHGVGRYLWHAATFPNAGYKYVVNFSVDRLDENHPIEGSIHVLNGDKLLATLKCGESSIYNNMDILYE